MQRKCYTSLTQLRDELLKTSGVEILQFTGSHLIVNNNGTKIRYGLCDGIVSQREDREEVECW